MAPNISKKKPSKGCKKYTYTEHSKYSKWEKERRDRFNVKLEELAICLPNYNKENPWKKVEIIENAILNIRSRQIGANKAHEETIRTLSVEVNQLKNVILEFTGLNKCSEDIFKITSREISVLLKQIINKENENHQPVTEEENLEDDENLAFVAKIAQSNDHCYSIQVSEPNLQVDSEEIVETIDITEDCDTLENSINIPLEGSTEVVDKPIIIDLVNSYNLGEAPAISETVTLPTLTLEPVPVNTNLNIPQIINLKHLNPQNISLSSLKGSNVTTIFVNKGSRASILQQPTILSGTNQDMDISNVVRKIAIPRLKVNKKIKPKRKTYSRRRKSKTKKSEEKELNNKENESLDLPTESDKNKTSINKVQNDCKLIVEPNKITSNDENNISNPATLEKEVIDLQNNEEIEILEETIKEDTEKSKKDAENKENTKQSSEKIIDIKSEIKKKLETTKKKSKSSYSIAALCQISVNIGDRPEMANSPGVMSLNSVGTISPANTPAPTPTPDTIKSFGIDTCSIVIDNQTVTEDHVIEELRTIRPEDVSLLQQIEVNTTVQSENAENYQSNKKSLAANISPSQNFLSNFPVVSKQSDQDSCDNISSSSLSVTNKTIQRDIYQVLKDLDTELNLENEEVKDQQVKTNDKNSQSNKSKDSSQESLKTPSKEILPKRTQTIKPIDSISSKASVQCSQQTPHSRSVTTTTSSTKTVATPSSAALSVYDFSASKPETPPIPLQKTRNKDIKATQKPSKANDESLKPHKSPEKKTYTEMQTKSKKSPPDPKPKFSESRKHVDNQNQQIHQQPNPYIQPSITSMDTNYDTRLHHHQQDTLMHRQHIKHGGTNYHQPPTPTTYNSQHPVTRHSYMAPHYPYQSMVSTQHVNPNIHPYHHGPHPYNHPPVPVGEPDMKTQFHHNSKYSCSSHGSYLSANVPDFHARNYYSSSKHYVPTNAHYRNFHTTNDVLQPGQDVGQQYSSDRKRPMPPNQHQMDMSQINHQERQTSIANMSLHQADKVAASTVQTSGTTFSVTQLVNSNQQRKGTKRSSSAAAKPSKQPRTDSTKDNRQNEKEDCRKPTRSNSSRRNKSGTRSNYSAESLISSSGATTQTIAENREDTKLKVATSPTKNSSPKGNSNVDKSYSAPTRASSNWSNDVNHFGGLQFSSLSPSPASLFPTDLSSIDFPMSIFGPQDVNLGSKEYLQGSSSQNIKSGNKQQAACQLGNQRSAVADWTLNLDNSFLPPLPTLTPPNDPMGDPMAGYSFMSPMSHSHSGFYPCASAPQAPPRIQNQSYSAHSAANIPVSGYSQAMTVMSKTGVGGHHSFPPSQMVAIPPLAAGGNSQTGSLVNFNLSTIFPEINGQPNCQVKLAPGIPPPPPPGGMDFLQNTRSGQLATPDLLPHSIALLGHSSHQVMPSFSVSSNMVPGITFPNIPEQ